MDDHGAPGVYWVLFVNVGAGPLDTQLARIFVKLALLMELLIDPFGPPVPGTDGKPRYRRERASGPGLGPPAAGTPWADDIEGPPRGGPQPIPIPGFALLAWRAALKVRSVRRCPGERRSRVGRERAHRGPLSHAAPVGPAGHSGHQGPQAASRYPSGLPAPLQEPTVQTLSDLIATLRGLDLIVSGRFHGILLGLRLGKPVLALGHQCKIEEASTAECRAERLRHTDGRHGPGHAERACDFPREGPCRDHGSA